MKQWERKVRSASSLDELLRLADFPDWKLWKCRLRLQQPQTFSSPPSVGSHRSTRYAAESYSLEILKGWINNIQYMLSLCLCVDVVMNIVCLPFQPQMKSGSGLSACQEKHVSMWPRSQAPIHQCSSSHPVCLSTGSFNVRPSSMLWHCPCILNGQTSQQSFMCNQHSTKQILKRCPLSLPDLSRCTVCHLGHLGTATPLNRMQNFN